MFAFERSTPVTFDFICTEKIIKEYNMEFDRMQTLWRNLQVMPLHASKNSVLNLFKDLGKKNVYT